MGAGGARVLIAGLGSIGKRHLANLQRLRPDSTIGVLRTRRQAISEASPEGCDLQFFDIEDALAFDPDAAIVAAPAPAHVLIASHFIDAGTHVLVEKPLSDQSDGARALVAKASAAGIVVMVGYNLRFSESLQEAKTMIDEQVIGRVCAVQASVGQYLPDWRPGTDYRTSVSAQRSLGGGALLELSHEIDLVHWFCGRPECITARGGSYSGLEVDVEDLVELILEYPAKGLLASVHLDMIQRAPQRQCRFVGSEGTLEWDGITGCLRSFVAEKGEWEEVVTTSAFERNDMYLSELEHFLACVETGDQPMADASSAVEVLEVIEAARRSLEENTTVPMSGVGERGF